MECWNIGFWGKGGIRESVKAWMGECVPALSPRWALGSKNALVRIYAFTHLNHFRFFVKQLYQFIHVFGIN
jgi:hypothetical protein